MARRLSAIFTSAFPSGVDDNPATSSHSSQRKASADLSQSRSPGRLSKQAPVPTQARSASAHYLAPDTAEPTLPNLQSLQLDAATNSASVLIPPPAIGGGRSTSRSASGERSRPGTPGGLNPSRPSTPTFHLSDQPVPHASDGHVESNQSEQEKKKHWWNKKDRKDGESRGPVAWIAGHPQKVAYDIGGLVSARPMQEMWNNDDGNCFVYLFPRSSPNKGPSFRIDSAVFASSPVLTKLAFGDIYTHETVASGDRRHMPADRRTKRISLDDPATPPMTPNRKPLDNSNSSTSSQSQGSGHRHLAFSDSQEVHLYLPIKPSSDGSIPTQNSPEAKKSAVGEDKARFEDLQTLVDYRNFFAFLCGQSLVATERRSSFFSIFMTIAGILRSFQFSNVDGSTYGEVAHTSFDAYVEELGLADVRSSREKCIEGVVLGERMKNVALYNEAFTHSVGKHQDLLSLKSPRFAMISPITQNRLVRAAMDLDKRVASVRLILTDFDFPFLFSGIMSSKTSIERKEGVRFDAWKEHFLGMRKFMMGLLKQRFGDWPPKASSKKNTLETSGLNRLVLRDLYHDLSSLYDLLVDRNHLTTRTIDDVNLDETRDEPVVRGLRAVLSEYDRSTPPVKPPVPFDLPRLPNLKMTRNDFGVDAKKDAKARQKKIKDEEIQQLLHASSNSDLQPSPFVDAFREMEKRAAHGCNISELEDLRIGQWIFMYAVLQALPMLACDAPSLKWTNSVEYFLCEPPRSGVPWADPNAAGGGGGKRTWFSVGGTGGGVVSLPSDLVEHGIEGIYKRSHCWIMAEKWCAANPILSQALHMQQAAGGAELHNPGHTYPPSGNDLLRPESKTSNRSSKRLSSLGLGLEALPLPAGVTPDGRAPSPMERSRTPAHSVDTSKTFDSILADVNAGKGKKRK